MIQEKKNVINSYKNDHYSQSTQSHYQLMANDMSVKELLQIILFYLIWLQNMLLKDVKV